MVGYQNLSELSDKLKPFSYRVLKEDCLDLPDKIYMKREIQLTYEQKRLYKQRYNNSILSIVKNGYGFLLLFYRDGRGSGLGYYLLNKKFSNENIGIKKNTRDYHAAMQLLKEFILLKSSLRITQ